LRATAYISLSLNASTLDGFNFLDSPAGTCNYWLASVSTPMADNFIYSDVITAQDANGNRATNTFTFNTWTSDNPFIEAEDYNFNSGAFIPPPNSFPDTFNGYAGLLGNIGIDYLEYDSFGVPNAYRPNDLPQL